MPGGSKYRQWYAMRSAMQERGTWRGNQPTHSVPEREEGEPAPKEPRTSEPSPETPESLPPLEDSPTEEGKTMSHTGVAILGWVKPESTLLTNLSEETKQSVSDQLLFDFQCLIGIRWNMDMTIGDYQGIKYVFGVNTRITIGESTIRAALGNLADHCDFLRGNASNTFDQLANYKVCKEKWKVPDKVTDSTFGWEAQGHQGTSQETKRRKFF